MLVYYEGGELFKDYGEDWFIYRTYLGQIPVLTSYNLVIDLMSEMIDLFDNVTYDEDNESTIDNGFSSIVYDELIMEIKNIWDSRTLNAIHDFDWKDVKKAVGAGDMGILLQQNATRSIDWLDTNGKCIDHIVSDISTLEGAG